MKVKKHTLLLLACVVWSIAGWNVLRIGLSCYPPYLSILNLLISAAVFALFEKMVFGLLAGVLFGKNYPQHFQKEQI